jgi:uncharacterized Ntn-hydrolase superfamily protein
VVLRENNGVALNIVMVIQDRALQRAAQCVQENAGMDEAGPLVSTFSIVGYDPNENAWGIAIASRFLAVGAQTCWGESDTGVIVLQAYLNASNGARGLALLRQDLVASQVIDRLMADDPHRDLRQIAIIDNQGNVAAYTGVGCSPWAGHVIGDYCAAQGNMLLGDAGCSAMVEYFSASRPATLARRLVDALAVGDKVAGDKRGRQASALYVIRPSTAQPFDVFTEPTINLRVDDHENPFAELSRLLDLYELIYHPTSPDERLAPSEESVRRLQKVLSHLRYYSGEATGQLDDLTKEAMTKLGRMENFHRRLGSTEWLDRRLLGYLEARFNLKL